MRLRFTFAALVLVALAAPVAWSQVRIGERHTLLVGAPEDPILTQHPVPALAGAQLEQLSKALKLRDAGQLDPAKDGLTSLLAQVPHHPLVLTELARVQMARNDFAAIEKLGKSERASQKDSLLLAHELALAYERLGRPREAAEIAFEAWSASPDQAEWASTTLLKLVALQPKSIRESMKKFAERVPARIDVARGLALLELRLGDVATAMRTLAAAERPKVGMPLRWTFAEDLLQSGTVPDSMGAMATLLDLAGDVSKTMPHRVAAAQRVWEIYRNHGAESDGAPRVLAALKDLPAPRWPAELLGGVVRGLRQGGHTAESRALLESRGAAEALPPELALEQALADLKDGPPERALPALLAASAASPEGAYRYAEALFYSGNPDSALGCFKRIAGDSRGPYAGAALERLYLLEDAEPRSALPMFGRIAYESWRGDPKRSLALSDTLYRSFVWHGPLWAQAAFWLSERREADGDLSAALQPMLAVADSLPADRLAPVARERAGDLYLKLKDESHAAAAYEDCVAQYPRAWNAPQVRRKLETLRREKRF